MKLWLDDLSPMPERFDVHVKTAGEAIELIKAGKVEEMSLDHDLGETSPVSEYPGTGYLVARAVEELAYYGEIKRIKWNVHSANSVGAKNMEAALRCADKYWSRHERMGR